MALTQVGYADVGTAGSSSGTSAAISVPGSLNTNDLVVLVMQVNYPSDTATIAAPTGSGAGNASSNNNWVQLTNASFHMSPPGEPTWDWQVAAFYHYINGDTGSWTFTWTGSSSLYCAYADVWRGAPTYLPIDLATTAGTSSAGMTETWGALTLAQVNEAVVLVMLQDEGQHIQAGTPTGYTIRTPTSPLSYAGGLADNVYSASGSTGSISPTMSGSTDQTATFIAIRSIGIPQNTVAPTISGTAQQGATLTAANGTWNGSPTFTYLWSNSHTGAISGATSSTYVPQASDVGYTITVTVTGTNSGGTGSATSAATAVITASSSVPANSGGANLPTITGTATDGQTLTAGHGTWTNSPTSYAYQWNRGSGPITGATGTTYACQAADIGAKLTLTVIASNASGPSLPAVSAATGQVLAPTPSAAAPIVGETLTISGGSWTDSPSSFIYQWFQVGGAASIGTNSATYVIRTVDAGFAIDATVTAVTVQNSQNYDSLPATLGATGIVTGPPVAIGPPVISGATVQGQTLVASTGGWSSGYTAPTNFTYQWTNSASGAISGATSNTYQPQASDVGDTLTVTVTAYNTATSTGVTTTSAATPVITSTTSTSLTLSLAGFTISWNPVTGTSSYVGAISTAARGVTGRTTISEPNLALATSWNPSPQAGSTLYYGVGAQGLPAGTLWSTNEEAIAWPAVSNRPRVCVSGFAGWNMSNIPLGIAGAPQTWDRTWTPSTPGSWNIQSRLNEGVKFMMLYGQTGGDGILGVTPSTCASQILSDATYIKGLVNQTTGQPCGMTDIEFGNEVYYNGSLPADYAAQYIAAHNAIAGMGINLGVSCTTYYQRADGTFSDPAAGAGWIIDFFNAVDGAVPIDALIFHPYGPINSTASTSQPYNPDDQLGWPCVSYMYGLAQEMGYSGPVWVTEFGQDLAGSEYYAALSQAQQGTNLVEACQSLLTTDSLISGTPYSYVNYLAIYADVDDAGSVNYGVYNGTSTTGPTTPRPAWTDYVAWRQANAALIQ
jgi:hypothetical protein